MTRRLTTLTLLMVLTVSAAAQTAQLGDKRWREFGYGVSLLPPKDAAVVDDPPGEALVAFIDPDGTQFSLTIREALNPMDINELKKLAAQQLTMPFPSWLPTDDPDPITTLAGHPAGRIYMTVVDKDKGDWVMGHVFILLDDFLFINLQMQTSAAAFRQAHQTFTAVAESIALMDPAELDRMRTSQIEAGEAWLKTLDRTKLIAATPPSQLFRIIVADKDVGFMKITHNPDEQLGIPGHRVLLQAHTEGDRGSTDVTSEYFEADNDRSELWGTHITERRSAAGSLPGPAEARNQPVNLTETGTRGYSNFDDDAQTGRGAKVDPNKTIAVIDVHIETQSRIEDHAWPVPEVAFLSQFKKVLMGPVLPRQKTTMSFYAYAPEVKKMALMTVRVEPIVQGPYRGGYTVGMRPAPNIREQTFIYKADGSLAEWRPGDGRLIKATTPDELKKVWAGRGQ